MKVHLTYEFDSEDELRSHLGETATPATTVNVTATAPATPATPTPAASGAPATGDEPTRSSLDGDGMPYSDEIHADPPSFTADGRWRAKRGKADEAKQARADFLAKGGNVTPPAELPATPPAAAAPAAAPSAPTAAPALPASAPEPVTIESLYGRIGDLLNAAKLDKDSLGALYQKHAGAADPDTVHAVLSTNETVRAAMLADLVQYGEIE